MNCRFKDIVITGYSAISAAGIGLLPVMDHMRAGTTALTPIPGEILGVGGLRQGKVTGFRVSEFMSPMKARKLDRCSQFAVAATGMALKDAGISLAEFMPERIGIALGSGFCGVANSAEFLTGYFEGGVEGLLPMIFPNTVPNAPASNASIEYGFKGPNVSLVQRFCSAESSILQACRFIEEGRADVMLVGGSDELTPLIMKGFAVMGQMKPQFAPFGEGCGIIVIERASHAKERGAVIRGTIEEIRTIGMLLPGLEQQGLDILLGSDDKFSLISYSGIAVDLPGLTRSPRAFPACDVGNVIGRSLAMGGIALAAMTETLSDGELGLHLSASPHGPLFAVEIRGGANG